MSGAVVLRVPANYKKPARRKYRVAQAPRPVGRSGFHKVIARIPGGPFYTVSEVAWVLEVNPKTIKAWIRHGKIKRASRYVEISGSLVYLYTTADLERIRRYAENH